MALYRDFGVRYAEPRDLPTIVDLETASYPADEAATPEKLTYRLLSASELFMVLEGNDAGGNRKVFGFVCATASSDPKLTHDSMSKHEPDGRNVCIHSVVISESMRRRGLAQFMLCAYLRNVAASGRFNKFLLLTHEHNMKLYARCGFSSNGVSEVSHGSETWMEMQKVIAPSAAKPLYYQVDAFTLKNDTDSSLQSGNPAGLVFLPGVKPYSNAFDEYSGSWMQDIAKAVKLPMTAFIRHTTDGMLAVRFFTVLSEAPMCGHASLAIAHVLFSDVCWLPASQTTVTLITNNGTHVTLRRVDSSENKGSVQLTTAALPHTPLSDAAERDSVLALLPSCLRLPADRVGFTGEDDKPGVHFVGKNALDMLFVVSPDVFRDMKVDVSVIAKLPARIITFTTRDSSEEPVVCKDGYTQPISFGSYDVVSRCFAPALGNDEDPVCGTAHCGIVPWLRTKGAATYVNAFQASPRGGVLHLFVEEDGRISIRGDAKIFSEGVLA